MRHQFPTYHRVSDGAQVPESEAFDARGVLRDGHTMRSKVTLRDGVPSVLTDADLRRKSDQIERYEKNLNEAWRNPPQLADVVLAADAKIVAAKAATGNAYERYEARLADAWR